MHFFLCLHGVLIHKAVAKAASSGTTIARWQICHACMSGTTWVGIFALRNIFSKVRTRSLSWPSGSAIPLHASVDSLKCNLNHLAHSGFINNSEQGIGKETVSFIQFTIAGHIPFTDN